MLQSPSLNKPDTPSSTNRSSDVGDKVFKPGYSSETFGVESEPASSVSPVGPQHDRADVSAVDVQVCRCTPPPAAVAISQDLLVSLIMQYCVHTFLILLPRSEGRPLV